MSDTANIERRRADTARAGDKVVERDGTIVEILEVELRDDRVVLHWVQAFGVRLRPSTLRRTALVRFLAA